jgi:hypothetical protein
MIECPGLLSCPGLTLASIYSRMLDCRVKPGNDEERKSARSANALQRSWQDAIAAQTPVQARHGCRIGARWDSVSFR